MRNPKFVLNEQIQAGIGGTNQPTVSPTATPKPQKAVETDIIVDQDKGAGLGTTRTEAALNQQAEMISEISPTKNSFINKFKDKYSEDLAKFDSILDERKGKKASAAERRKANLEKDKYLALAQVGLNILSQDGGQTFLQALGKGSKDVIPTLMKLNREELEIAENLDDLDFETAKEKLGFSKAQYDKYVKDRMLDITERKAETERLAAQGKMGKEGAPLSMAMLQGYARSITGLPPEALQNTKFLTDLAVASREDAIKSLRASGRGALVGDTGTIQSEQIRQIQLNPERYLKLYGKTLPNKMESGAFPGNIPQKPSATDRLNKAQEELRNMRSGTPVTG